MRRRRYYYEDDNSWAGLISALVVIYLVWLLIQYYSNRGNFWRWLAYGVAIFIILFSVTILFRKLKDKRIEKRVVRIIDSVKKAGLEEYIKNFITRFGLGQEKSKNFWQRRGYRIDWNRINDLKDFLQTKGINFTLSDVNTLLTHYIDEREYEVTSKSIGVTTRDFKKLSGVDFEKLLYRLYTTMGYSIQLTGKVGDQGGDLVANKGGERILIQAKRWSGNVGNDAVQQAAAAQKFYDCNKAIVIAASEFTPEAVSLAKANNTELIGKHQLQEMLLKYLGESWS